MGLAPFTLEEMRKTAAANGGECLATSYKNTGTIVPWRCNKGHEWSASYGNVRSGSWCKKCRHKMPSIEDVHKYALSRDGYCFSSKYVDANSPLEWGCAKGHRWRKTLSDVKSAINWCRKCDYMIGPADAQALAKSRAGRCLTTEFSGGKVPLEWECETQHRWTAPYSAIRHGYWCPHCAGVGRKTIADAQRLASAFEGECLAEILPGSVTCVKWKCKRNHIWSATYESVRNKRWCRECVKVDKLEKARAVAKNKGGRCLSTIYISAKEHMTWRCEFGHEWNTAYDKVVNSNHWCSDCRIPTVQKYIADAVKNLLSAKIMHNYRGFVWLKTRRNNSHLELDIWVPDYSLAIEYDGIQHFEPISFGGKRTSEQKISALKDIQYRDRVKTRLIKKHPHVIKHFIRFNYKEKNLLTPEYIRDKLIKAGVKI